MKGPRHFVPLWRRECIWRHVGAVEGLYIQGVLSLFACGCQGPQLVFNCARYKSRQTVQVVGQAPSIRRRRAYVSAGIPGTGLSVREYGKPASKARGRTQRRRRLPILEAIIIAVMLMDISAVLKQR